jgi:hypothetical protein
MANGGLDVSEHKLDSPDIFELVVIAKVKQSKLTNDH